MRVAIHTEYIDGRYMVDIDDVVRFFKAAAFDERVAGGYFSYESLMGVLNYMVNVTKRNTDEELGIKG